MPEYYTKREIHYIMKNSDIIKKINSLIMKTRNVDYMRKLAILKKQIHITLMSPIDKALIDFEPYWEDVDLWEEVILEEEEEYDESEDDTEKE